VGESSDWNCIVGTTEENKVSNFQKLSGRSALLNALHGTHTVTLNELKGSPKGKCPGRPDDNNHQHFEIIHRPLFYLKHDVSETGFCLRNVMFQIKGRTMDNVQDFVGYARGSQKVPGIL
jgi:hypothetical protein